MNIDKHFLLLMGERFIFIFLSFFKYLLIIGRLEVRSYVMYTSLTSFTILIATLTRFGVELLFKKYIPLLQNDTGNRNIILSFIMEVSRKPLASIFGGSFLAILFLPFIGLNDLNILFIYLIIVSLSLHGLIYELLIALSKNTELIIFQISSVGITTVVIYLFLGKNSSIYDFLPILTINNVITLLLGIIITVLVFRKMEDGPIVANEMKVDKLYLSFLFIASNLIIRRIPISMLNLVDHIIVTSVAIYFSIIDVMGLFYKQVGNYVLTRDNPIDKFARSSIFSWLIVAISSFGVILGLVLVKTDILLLVINLINDEYSGNSIYLAFFVFALPLAILMLFSNIFDALEIKFHGLNRLSRIRSIVAAFLIMFVGIVLLVPDINNVVMISGIVFFEYIIAISSFALFYLRYNKYKEFVVGIVGFTIPFLAILFNYI